jgi:hypothetical protein
MNVELIIDEHAINHIKNYLKFGIVDLISIKCNINGKIESNILINCNEIGENVSELIELYFTKLFETYGKEVYYYYNLENEAWRFDSKIIETTGDNIMNIISNIFAKHNVDIKYFLYHNSNVSNNQTSNYGYTKLNSMGIWHTHYVDYLGIKILNKTIQKKFLFLNRIAKKERYFLYEKFNELNMLDEMLYSINAINDSKYPTSVSLDSNSHFALLNQDFYNSVFCNIITESEFYTTENLNVKDAIFFTEKTGKCIAMGLPFVMVNGHSSISKLKELGFQTFDKWWDESYDDEPNEIDRLNKIVNTIVEINKWSIAELQTIYDEMKPILEHNLLLYNKFTNKKYNRQLFFPKPFSDYNCFY